MNRLELTPTDATSKSSYKKIVLNPDSVDNLFVDVFLEDHRDVPKQIILDVDVTDDPLHGNQEGKFFHGYYKAYCYLPLYIFCGEHLLCGRLRTANNDAAIGTVEELERIVQRIQSAWPDTQIIVRGGSGFCREDIMIWCEDIRYDITLNILFKTLPARPTAPVEPTCSFQGGDTCFDTNSEVFKLSIHQIAFGLVQKQTGHVCLRTRHLLRDGPWHSRDSFWRQSHHLHWSGEEDGHSNSFTDQVTAGNDLNQQDCLAL